MNETSLPTETESLTWLVNHAKRYELSPIMIGLCQCAYAKIS